MLRLLVFLPVDSVEVAAARELVTTERRGLVEVGGLDGHPAEPAVEFTFGDVAVEGEQIGGEEAYVVYAASVVVEITPEQHPGIADFAGPFGNGEGDPEFRFDGTNSGHRVSISTLGGVCQIQGPWWNHSSTSSPRPVKYAKFPVGSQITRWASGSDARMINMRSRR